MALVTMGVGVLVGASLLLAGWQARAPRARRVLFGLGVASLGVALVIVPAITLAGARADRSLPREEFDVWQEGAQAGLSLLLRVAGVAAAVAALFLMLRDVSAGRGPRAIAQALVGVLAGLLVAGGAEWWLAAAATVLAVALLWRPAGRLARRAPGEGPVDA